jgi:hypothetical protein
MSNFLENKNKIRKELSESVDLKQTISKIQKDLGNLDEKNFQNLDNSLFEFTDLIGSEKTTLYAKIFSNFQEKILLSIETLDSKSLENLLLDSFPYLEFDDLKIIPLTILQKIEKIPDSILTELANSPNVLMVNSFVLKY